MSKKREYRSLLTILSINAPDECENIIRKHGGNVGRNTDARDLELKLAELYAKSNNKIDLEKDFANAHPHKDFILKYNKPKPIIKEVRIENPVIIETPAKKEAEIAEMKANADGEQDGFLCQNCNDKYSSAESVIDVPTKSQSNTNSILILSAISIAAIVTLAICMKR